MSIAKGNSIRDYRHGSYDHHVFPARSSCLCFTIIVSLILISLSLHSQVTLRGRITDQKNHLPLFGVNVFVPDLYVGATTDTGGNYSIPNLPKRKILLRISYVGYKTIIEPVDPSGTFTKDFAIEESPEEINEVVVTGTSHATDIRRSPIPIVVTDIKAINMTVNTNIIDALTKIPGVSAVTTGPNVSKPYIHGLGYNRVLTLFDGVRQEGQQWGDEHGIEVDQYGIERAEVIKGPSSLTYGSDALAGVVNLIPFSPATTGAITGNFLGEYQTNNGMFGASLAVDGNHKGILWGGRVSHKQAKDYQNRYDGRVYNTAFSETDAKFYTGVQKSWGFTHFDFTLFSDLQEIPDGSRDSATRQFTKQITEADTFRPIVNSSELNSYSISVLHQNIRHYRIYSNSNIFLNDGKISLTASYQFNHRQEYSHPEAPSTAGLDLHLHTVTWDLKYHLPEKKGWEITPGINGLYQNNSNTGTEFIIPDYIETDAGIFLLVKKSLEKIDISAGVRYDFRFITNDEMFTRVNPSTGFEMQVFPPDTAGAVRKFSHTSHSYSGVSASLGATWNLTSEFGIKGNIARGFRAPGISEISANGVHPGTNIYQLGNTEFRPEFSLQGDLGLFYNSKPVLASLEAFYNDITNYIFNQKVLNREGHDSIIVKGSQTFQFHQSEAVLYGGEANIDIHFFKWMHFENSVSMVYAINKGGSGVQITDSSKYLPLIPPLHFHTELRVEFEKVTKHLSSIYALLAIEFFDKQNRAYLEGNTETPTPGYVIYNAGLGGDFVSKKGKTICSLHLAVSNIFDLAYQSHLSRLKYFEPYPNNPSGRSGIYDIGRNFSVKVIFPITI